MTAAPRKLATIVALDVAGYSARTEADEARTTAEIATLRKVIEDIAALHGGRVFNTAGDGFMLEFGSSLAAVEAAFALAETCEPKVRVGVHLGDVVVQSNGDLLGHGVNVAARLMAKCDPGGVLVSADVRRTIRGPLAERLVTRGLHKLDKMSETIEAFALVASHATSVSISGATTLAAPASAPEPMLAVLPFENLSADTEMQYFSDGISDDLLQCLARNTEMKVLGRASTFQYRGADKSVRKVATDLRATHVLDGSVRRAGARVRIAAQLVEAAGQTMLWSERYDRNLEDIFAVQDEIAEAIAAALSRTFAARPSAIIDPTAYDLYLRATTRSNVTAIDQEASLTLLDEVVRLAPAFANGWGARAEIRAHWSSLQPYADRPAIAASAMQDAERAFALDPDNPRAALALLLLVPPLGHFIEAGEAADRLAECAQNFGHALIFVALQLGMVGRWRDAIDIARRAFERDPHDLVAVNGYGFCLINGGRFAEARPIAKQAAERWPEMQHAAANWVTLSACTGDWVSVDAILSPQRQARFPLRELMPLMNMWTTALRDPSPETCRRIVAQLNDQVARTGHADFAAMTLAARLGAVDDVFALAARATFGPANQPDDVMGFDAYRTYFLLSELVPEIRQDARFVGLCHRVGLVDYWIATKKWPDCADEVPYDFRGECAIAAAESRA